MNNTVAKNSGRLTLANQVEVRRNLYEHRMRLMSTQKELRSSSHLKKSMTFDRRLVQQHSQHRKRRQNATAFKNKEAQIAYGMDNLRLLRKIVEKEKKQPYRSNSRSSQKNTTLHHNSFVSITRSQERVQTQNVKLHFRINSVKSMYSLRSINKHKPKINLSTSLSKSSQMQQTNPETKDSLRKVKSKLVSSQMFESSNSKKKEADSQPLPFHLVARPLNQKQGLEWIRSQMRPRTNPTSPLNDSKIKLPSFSKPTTPCQRLRNQELAQKLLLRKLKMQSSAVSRIKMGR